MPFHIPVAMALLDTDGSELPLRLYGEHAGQTGTRVLQLCQAQDTFVFHDFDSEPMPSLLRGFSAPIRLEVDYNTAELIFLLAQDRDPFCRWEAGQQLSVRLLLSLSRAWQAGEALQVPEDFVMAVRAVVPAQAADAAFQALALTLPSETYLAEFMDEIDPQALHAARQFLVSRGDWYPIPALRGLMLIPWRCYSAGRRIGMMCIHVKPHCTIRCAAS